MKISFSRKNGSLYALFAFQIMSLIPAFFIVLATLYPYVMASSAYAAFCNLGVSALPRWEALLLSLLYRLADNEVILALILPGVALIAGIVFKRLLTSKGKKAKVSRFVLAGAIGLDLILRIFPFSLIALYGWGCAIFGFLFRGACLALILWDLTETERS